jgi:hypothetical protein
MDRGSRQGIVGNERKKLGEELESVGALKMEYITD